MYALGDFSALMGRFFVGCLLSLALTGCFFVPGQFQSALDIRRDGHFTYSYVGEVVFFLPSDEMLRHEGWDDSMAECADSESEKLRPCTATEVVAKRQAYENTIKQDREAGEDLTALIGYNPVDKEANERLAAELMQYPGWKQVRYLGNATFHVDYEMRGTLDRDFAFPIVPQVQFAMPFVNIARNKAGIANISAAGLASQQLRRLIVGQTPMMDRDDPYYDSTRSIIDRTRGAFIFTTDAEIMATNGQRSHSGNLEKVEWVIDGKSGEAPKIQISLSSQS